MGLINDRRDVAENRRARATARVFGRQVARVDGSRLGRVWNAGVDPGWAEYNQRKAIWLAAHPEATDKEIERACRRFATELGL